MERIKSIAKRIPIVRAVAGRLYVRFLAKDFSTSEQYWIERYEKGRNSGPGSYNQFSEFKAEILNAFVDEHGIKSVIEYGCGDGNQLELASYKQYLGFDVSPVALSRCKTIFKDDATKSFKMISDYSGETAELTLSLDVIFHLIEDEAYETYMTRLFSSSTRFVAIYSSNKDTQDTVQAPHVKHRAFVPWVQVHHPDWQLLRHIPNKHPYQAETGDGSFADFYIYQKR